MSGNPSDDNRVDKIVFTPNALDINKKVRKVSDPPPRPLPGMIDNRSTEVWTPKVKKRFKGKELFESMQKVGEVLKYVMFASLGIISLAGIGYVCLWLVKEYNLGG